MFRLAITMNDSFEEKSRRMKSFNSDLFMFTLKVLFLWNKIKSERNNTQGISKIGYMIFHSLEVQFIVSAAVTFSLLQACQCGLEHYSISNVVSSFSQFLSH